MVDAIIVISVISAVAAVVGLIVTNFWNSLQRKDKQSESREVLEYEVENTARAKFLQEQALARDLQRENQIILDKFKEDMRDYVDKGDLDVKRELAYAIKLIDKDIKFLQQFIFGKESKSMAAYTRGETDTKEHYEQEGEGIFRDTQEEEWDRKKRNRGGAV